MAQNDIEFILGEGGLGREKPNEDHVSLLLFEHAAQPPSWGSGTIRSFRSLVQLEQSGIFKYDPFYAEVHYQVSEFFRRDVDSEVYVGFKVMSTGTADTQATLILSATGDGRVRQLGGFIGQLTDIVPFQALANKLFDEHAPLVCAVGCDFVVDFNAIPDLHVRTDDKVNVLASGDGEGEGIKLAAMLGVTYLPCVGAEIGALSLALVSESIAWVDKFNMSDGEELEVPIFSNGILLKNALTADLDNMHDKGFTYLRKHRGISGSYFNDSYTATDLESDYVTLENNRTIQKAVRVSRAKLLKELSAPVKVDATTGKLSINYVEHLKSISDNGLFPMEQNDELSGFQTIIDPNQNILSTSKIEIALELVPIGVSRKIVVNIGFVLRLSQQS